MPVNAGFEFGLAQEEFNRASTTEEKIRALEKMLTTVPKHKSSEGIQKEIKTKLAKLRDKVEKQRAKKSGYSISIKKEGAASVVLVGLTKSGKSYVLSRITNAKPEISQYEYTTKMPEVGTMDYEGVKIQVIELPSFFEGYADSSKGPSFISIARTADLIVIVLDGTKELNEQLYIIENEFRKSFVNIEKEKNALVLINIEFRRFFCNYKVVSLENLKEQIWKKLNLVYVYTKLPGKPKDYPPVAMGKGSTVGELAGKVHKDFVRRFKFARVWGKSVKHDSAQVGLTHILEEGDIIEFHLK